jgi:hypothetical protein
MTARTTLGYVAAIVALELLLIMIAHDAGQLGDFGVAWYEPLRRIAPVASLLSEGQYLGARTLLLALGLALVPIKAILVAIAAAHARETRDMKDFVNIPSNQRVSIPSRIASGLFLASLVALLAFFVLGHIFSSGSERSAIFIIMREGGVKYWLVWHAGLLTLLSGVLGLCAFWAWDALQVMWRSGMR